MSTDGKSAPVPLTADHHSSSPFVSPDGKWIAFISDRKKAFDYEIWTMRVNGSEPEEKTRTTRYKSDPSFTADGKSLLFLSYPRDRNNDGIRYDLWRLSLADGKLEMIADSSLFDSPMTWKPDSGAPTPGMA